MYLLPVPHFHVVFTLPPVLHELVRHNEHLLYGELMRQSWAALQTLCGKRRYLGAQAGMLAVLHTWGQNLHYHPHVHALVPAGGLRGRRWIAGKETFLVPVRDQVHEPEADHRPGGEDHRRSGDHEGHEGDQEPGP